MEYKKLTWNTDFITSDDLMIHTFSDRVIVSSNIKTGETRTLKDGEVICIRNDLRISKYEEFLITVAEDAATLKNFE